MLNASFLLHTQDGNLNSQYKGKHERMINPTSCGWKLWNRLHNAEDTETLNMKYTQQLTFIWLMQAARKRYLVKTTVTSR